MSVSFLPAGSYPCGYSPSFVIAVDFNNDGIMDLAVTYLSQRQ